MLRAHGLLGGHRALSTAEFDEGVYASGAAALGHGDVPYRDFVFLHPPLLLIAYAPVAALTHAISSWSAYLVLARWLAVIVATGNVLLVALLSYRWRGWIAALVGSALAATYLPAVRTDAHVMLEPLVSLALLGCALAWVGVPRSERSDRRAVAAGVLGAAAALVKLTGIVGLVALTIADGRRDWRQRRLALAAALVTSAVVLVPMTIVAGPSTVLRQIVTTQLGRPGKDLAGGTIVGVGDRLRHLGSYGPFGLDRLPASAGLLGVLVAAAVVIWALRSGHQIARFFAVVAIGNVALILSSPDYYTQYPVNAFAGIAILLGGAAAAAAVALQRWRPAALAGGAALVVLLAAGAVDTAQETRDDVRGLPTSDPASGIASVIGDRCVGADEPQLLLALDRLEPPDASGRRFVDPFGAMMDEAIRRDDFADTSAALHSDRAQALLRSTLAACPFAITKDLDPPPYRWSAGTVAWFRDHFEVVATNDDGVQLWRRREGEA